MAEPIRTGDEVFMSLNGGQEQYVATAYWGVSYWFPTISSSKVKLRLDIVEPSSGDPVAAGTELKELDIIRLTATEERVGAKRLSAYQTEHNCYYYDADPGNRNGNQQWQVHAMDSADGISICYGDQIAFTNIYFSPQRLVPEESYLTTKVVGDTDSGWVLTKA
jgi:hypothetical protein